MYRNPEIKLTIEKGMDMSVIHSLLARALEFPDYYGKNWDAFDECINDLEASNPPFKLIVLGWDIFIREHLHDAKIFWSCMQKGVKLRKKPIEVYVSPRPCPCCHYLTLIDWHSGSYEICAVCNWEDDDVQFNDPSYRGGANHESLDEARARYKTNPRKTCIAKDFR